MPQLHPRMNIYHVIVNGNYRDGLFTPNTFRAGVPEWPGARILANNGQFIYLSINDGHCKLVGKMILKNKKSWKINQ